MPWPKQKRTRPKPSPVILRREGEEGEEVLDEGEFVRRQLVRANRRSLGSGDWPEIETIDYVELQEFFALRPGDVIVMRSSRAVPLWWFVVDVDAPQQTITARTFIFDQPREENFPFGMVYPFVLEHPEDINEAWLHHERLADMFRNRRVEALRPRRRDLRDAA